MVDNELPEDMWLGKERCMWPIYVFSSEDQALSWLSTDTGKRRVWRVDLIQHTEMEAVIPEPRLQVKR